MKADLIVTNVGELVTCSSAGKPKRGLAMLDLGIVENGAVAIADGRFIGVGEASEIARIFSSDASLDAAGCTVTPGFVDPHTHIIFAGDRLEEFELKIKGTEYLDILASGGGIISTVSHTRNADLTHLVESSRQRLDKMLACGTTTCEIKTGYGLDTETELKMLGAIEILDRSHFVEIVPTLLAAHAFPPEFKNDRDAYVDLICNEILPLARRWYEASSFSTRQVPFFADVFTERNAFDLAQTKRIFEVARDLGFGIKAHVDQFTNLGGSALAIKMHAASVDHLDAISDKEIELLAKSETIGIVVPTENFSAGKTTFANVRRLIDEGCAIAISTDYNPGSAPCPSLPMAMAIASRYQKVLPAEALNAATINAAHAIGLGDHIGSIEVGKQADLVILDSSDHRELAYEFGGNLVSTVVKKGRVVVGPGNALSS